MSVVRATTVRYRLLWSLLLLLTLALWGCKRTKPEPTPEKGKEPPKVEEKAEAPEPEPTPQDEPAAEAPAEVLDVVVEDAAAEEEPKVLFENVRGEPITDPTAGDSPPPAPPRGEYITGTDKKRLADLFVEMWCAEGRGASEAELLKIYHAYDYPPLANWHDYWSASMVDRSWVRDTVARARSRCPDVAQKMKRNENLEAPEPPTEPAEPAPSK